MTRTAEIHLSSDDMIQIAEAIGSWEKLQGAIGYLSTWNLTYPRVGIHRDGDTDLTAVYLDGNEDRQYVIGAVWHDTHYGFHS
jgi:hypothetical protein